MKKNGTSFVTIGSFLVFELLAFAAFSLANSVLLYGIVGFVIFGLLFLGTSLQIKHKGFTDFAIFVIPTILYGVLLLLSPFSKNLDSFTCLFGVLAMVSFSAIGSYMRLNESFKLSTAFLVIYGALAAYVLISFGWTMIQFEPFYTIKYAGAYLYYDGTISSEPIGRMAYVLMGFEFQKVSIEFFTLFPSLLTTSVVALFFISPKKETKVFIAYALMALLGFIVLILTPTKKTLLTDAALMVLYTFIYFFVFFVKNKQKVAKIGLITLGSIIGVLVLFITLNGAYSFDFVKSNLLTHKIFNANGLVAPINTILEQTLKNGFFFGYNPYEVYTDTLVATSNSFLFDNFMMSGVIGAILFLFIICWGVYSIYQMCIKSNVSLQNKTLIITFIVGYFGYCLINYDMAPYIYYSNFVPFFISGPFFIVLFLFGYSFKLKAQEVKEESEEKETYQKEIKI